MDGRRHFVRWDTPVLDDPPTTPSPSQTSAGDKYLNLPDTPGYLQTIGNRTSLPGSPMHHHAGPGVPQQPLDPETHAYVQEQPQQGDERPAALVRLSQAKVVLLGSVAAGKTSLLNTLRYGESRLADAGPDGRTIGIEVHSVALRPDTKLWFYDFGGHDTYHFSQQLFLTQRAIYLLAVDIYDYDSVKFEKVLRHWYTILTSRLVSPVICLLATHIDLCEDRHEMTRRCQDMHDKLIQIEVAHRKKLANELQTLKREVMSDHSDDADSIRKFQPRTLRQPMQRLNLLLNNRPSVFHSVCCISSKTLEGMDEFRENLISIVMDNESLFPQKDVPGSWIELSDAILSKKEDVPFVTMGEFMQLAQQFRIVGDHVQKVLSYLQSVGLVLHYQDYRQNSDLSKYVFVNPNLLLSIFGLVFNHNYFMDETRFVWKHKSILRLPHFDFVHLRKNLKERGIIGEKLLKCFWDALGISDEVYQAIVPLLEKFDLCYEIRIKPGDAVVEGRHFLFPYLLNKRKPQEVNFMWSDDLLDNFTQCGVELSFSQPDLPFGFLEKVLVRAHTYVDHCLAWKKGMVAFCDEGQDLVRIETSSDAHGHALLTLSARVRLDRKSMARHIILLLVAVTNRVLLHHYPGVVAYWYCQCAHCLVKSLEQKYAELRVDRFPADNIVYTSPGDTSQVHCVNCKPGESLRLDQVFPREQEDIHSLKRLVSEPCCRALKSSSPALIKYMNYREVMNSLLRKQLLTIKQAEVLGSKPNHDERAQQLLAYIMQSDQKAFEVLCEELRQNDETAWLAEEIRIKAAGRNAKSSKDSDSIGSTFLRSANQGWRGSQASQGGASIASISNWSTYSKSSYGSTGSYIRRPYGSFITREPVQNYMKSVSASSTPQQPRKEPPQEPNRPEASYAAQSRNAEYNRAPREAPLTEVKTVDAATEKHKAKLRKIREYPQEVVTRTTEVVREPRRAAEPVPPPSCEVEVATTAYIQTATPPPTTYTSQQTASSTTTTTYIDSYIVPDVPNQKDGYASSPQPQSNDDEVDVESPETRSSPMNNVYDPQRSNYDGTLPTESYTHPDQYETDLDAIVVPERSEEVKEDLPMRTEVKQEVLVEAHSTLEPYVPEVKENRPEPLPQTEIHRPHPRQQQQQHPQQPQRQLQQQIKRPHYEVEEQILYHVEQAEPQAPQPHAQPQQPHERRLSPPVQVEQLAQNLQEPTGQHEHMIEEEIVTQQEFPSQQEPLRQQEPVRRQVEKPTPASLVYEGTEIDEPRQQLQMPRDMRVRSTGDILNHVERADDRYPSEDGPASRHPQSSLSSSQLHQAEPRSLLRRGVGLIGSADLGPTHVLQDMDPITLPVRPIKRSRSSSLNRSMRSKSKSPQKVLGGDRNTWAVPYDWEQHNSMESLDGSDKSSRSRSGGFVFAASAGDLWRDNRSKRPTSSPPAFVSQPSLEPEESRYSFPKPTGKKNGDMPKHEYIEPLPVPAEFEISQSVPLQRKQMPATKPPLMPTQNIARPRPRPKTSIKKPEGQEPIDDEVFQQEFARETQTGYVPQSQHVQGTPVMQQQMGENRPMIPSVLSDCSEATESYHTGRSRVGSNNSDCPTITSNMSDLTVDSFHTVRSYNPSIAGKGISQGSHLSERTIDSYHTGRGSVTSDIADDATITSDISELTVDSLHTFNSGMSPPTISRTSPNTNTLAAQMGHMGLESYRRTSDDESTLTSKDSTAEAPFALDTTPNKPPMKIMQAPAPSQVKVKHAQRPSGPAPAPPGGRPVQIEENAPPVPPRRDLLGQAPPIPTRPPNSMPAPQQRPVPRSVTFADEYDQGDLKLGAPVSQVRQAKMVSVPRTEPQDTKSDQKKKKKKKKGEKKSKKNLLPYVGSNPESDRAVRNPAGNGAAQQGPQYQGQQYQDQQYQGQPYQGQQYQGQQYQGQQYQGQQYQGQQYQGQQYQGQQYQGQGKVLNNNPPVGNTQKDMVQPYVESLTSEPRMRMPHPVNPQVYTVHAQSPLPGDLQPKPHAYVQPYVHGSSMPGPWMDNKNANNGNKPPGNGYDAGKSQAGAYPYNGGNGNGIVLVEDPYVPTREANTNTALYRQPQHQQARHPPRGGATSLRPDSRGGHVTSRPEGRGEGQAGDRSSTGSQDSYRVVGSKDSAV